MAAKNTYVANAASEQMSAVLYWYANWSSSQRDRFMRNLLSKAIPHKMCTILDAMTSLTMNNSMQSMLECQLRLFDNWFRDWTDLERNKFLNDLERIDSAFVEQLNSRIAETSGQL